MENKIERIKSYCKIRSEYVTELKKRLLGPGSERNIHGDQKEEEEVISNSPKVNYFFGILYPLSDEMSDNDSLASSTDDDNYTENEGLENIAENTAKNEMVFETDSSLNKIDTKSEEQLNAKEFLMELIGSLCNRRK